MVTWVLWGLIIAMLAWMGYNYLRIRRAAKIVDNAEFESLIRTGQLMICVIQLIFIENISSELVISLQIN